MLLRICTLVFLFLARLRFPSSKSFLKIIKDPNGENVLKLVCKFERTDLRCRKAELDLSFLKYCFENSLTPKFLRFKVSNRSLKSSDAYRQCQIRLLKEEISNKKSIIRQRQSELVLLKNHLKASMNVIDYAHICSIFLISNDKILTKQKDIQDRKIIGLIKGKGKGIDPENVIFNFSSYVLSDNDKSLLSKGLNFSLPNKKVEISEYLCPFELLYREVSDFSKDSSDKELLKSKLKELSLSSHRRLKHNVLEENLSKKELESLKNLSKNPDIVIQKSDKGNSVVILDKKVYLEKMKEMLNKNDQFLKLSIQEEKHYNFLINLEKKIREPLKELYQLDIIDKKTYDKLCPVGSHFGILYGLAKVHKQLINNCPPFRPILSAIGTPTYNIAKFLVPILKPLTTNDYTLKDTFEFSRDILNQNPNLFMASLDVDSLFTNIPLDETINIIIEKLFSENETHFYELSRVSCMVIICRGYRGDNYKEIKKTCLNISEFLVSI